MMTQALPFTLPYWLLGIINFFAADDGADNGSDKTDDTNGDDDTFVDDLDEEFGEDEDDSEKGKDDKDKDKSDKSDKKDEKDKSAKKSSAVIQKQKYREQLREAQARIKELEGKKDDGKNLSEDEKKEKAANEFLVGKIKEVMEAQKQLDKQSEDAAEEAFQDELDAVLESNTDFTETQILDVCEDLDISPEAALKVLQREEKLKGKPKPKMPKSNKGSGKVEDDSPKDKKAKTLDDVNREAKEKIRQGLL